MQKNILFRIITSLHIAAALIFLGIMAYLGTFSRYIADDYCETVSVTNESPLAAVTHRYMNGDWRASNRYSNLLWVGFTERLIPNNIKTIPPIMFLLWALGLIWAIHEGRRLAGARWPIIVDVCLGTLLAFIPLFEAPNRFQTFYWRSSMATHFAPLVLLNFLIAALFLRIRLTKGHTTPIWVGFAFFLVSFFIGGFSEPPVTLIIVSASVSLTYVWFFIKNESRRPVLNLLLWILIGGILALVVMALSPAVSLLANSPSFLEWTQRTTQYTYFFLIDTLRTLPLPALFSIIVPTLLFYILFQQKEYFQLMNKQDQLKIFSLMGIAPLLLILLIAAGFSTSAFGQAYPVERARFFAYFLLTATLIFEGMLLGTWLSRIKLLNVQSSYVLYFLTLVLAILAYYPLRAGSQVLQEENIYHARALAWDERDAQIHTLIAQGETDLIVPQFDGVEGVKELDVFADHWINLCAAQYYGVNSIRAITVK